MSEIPPPPINVKEYWTLPPHEREYQLAGVKIHEEMVAFKKSVQIRYKGKMIDPEDYPCKCNLMDPDQCWEDLHPNAPDWMLGRWACKCRCHSTYEA